jgi:hypothetical protein
MATEGAKAMPEINRFWNRPMIGLQPANLAGPSAPKVEAQGGGRVQDLHMHLTQTPRRVGSTLTVPFKSALVILTLLTLKSRYVTK